MWNQTSEKLRRVADDSAFKNSAVPIFICDEELTVCARSAGAERLFARPAVRNNISPYISGTDIERLQSGAVEYISTSFSRLGESSYCLITTGIIENIRYYALMIEPMIRFCPPIEPWYIKESAKNISMALEKLLSGEKLKPYDLKTLQTRLCRLCSFVDSESQVGNVFSELNGILDFAVSASQSVLRSVRAELRRDSSPVRKIKAAASPTNVYMMTATMIAAAVMLSADGKLNLSNDYKSEDESAIITVTTSAGGLIKKGIDSYDKLIVPDNPLAMELAAMRDMADANGFLLEADTNKGILSLSVKLKAMAGNEGTFGSPEISGSEVEFFASLLTDMLALLELDR